MLRRGTGRPFQRLPPDHTSLVSQVRSSLLMCLAGCRFMRRLKKMKVIEHPNAVSKLGLKQFIWQDYGSQLKPLRSGNFERIWFLHQHFLALLERLLRKVNHSASHHAGCEFAPASATACAEIGTTRLGQILWRFFHECL